MAKKSAGILIYKRKGESTEVLLVHPGGPFFVNKDAGVWSIPKGEFGDDEDAMSAALRELQEETGFSVSGNFQPLDPVKLKSGKTVYAWAISSDPDTSVFRSNTFRMEWPPKSGQMKEFPEVDKAEWFPMEDAMEKIGEGQLPLLLQLKKSIAIQTTP